KARVGVGSRRCAPRPGVGAKMMVIAAGRHEERAGIAPHHFVEAKCVVIERFRFCDVVDVEVQMSEHCAWWHSLPRLALRRADQIVYIEMIRRHVQLLLVVAPGASGSVSVYLDAESVGIAEIDSFTHEVIRHSRVRSDLGEMSD